MEPDPVQSCVRQCGQGSGELVGQEQTGPLQKEMRQRPRCSAILLGQLAGDRLASLSPAAHFFLRPESKKSERIPLACKCVCVCICIYIYMYIYIDMRRYIFIFIENVLRNANVCVYIYI